MELTPAEINLIETLRQIEKENPLGIDDYTEEAFINICLQAVSFAPAEAGRRYRLFLEESKRQPFIDITEAQRCKASYEDLRATESSKAEYERNYKRWNLPTPIWITETTP